MIANNQNRVGKRLTGTLEEGDLVKLSVLKMEKDEAIEISDEIEKKLKGQYLTILEILRREIFKNWDAL